MFVQTYDGRFMIQVGDRRVVFKQVYAGPRVLGVLVMEAKAIFCVEILVQSYVVVAITIFASKSAASIQSSVFRISA